MSEVLFHHGTRACVLSEVCSEEEEDEVIEGMKSNLRAVDSLLGFYLDSPQNALGATGWDFLRGDILGFLSKEGQHDGS
mgnify:FL=1